MRKKFIILLILLCSFVIDCNALEINDISMNIYVDNEGNANVTEIWDVPETDVNYLYRKFPKTKNTEITDFAISTDQCEYTLVNNLFLVCHYAYDEGLTSNTLGFSVDRKTKFTINYKIKNFIAEFTDVKAMYYNLFMGYRDQVVKHLLITISSPYSFNDNSIKYSLRSNEEKTNIYTSNSTLVIETSDLSEKDELLLISDVADFYFNTDRKINNTYEIEKNYVDAKIVLGKDPKSWLYALLIIAKYHFIFLVLGIVAIVVIIVALSKLRKKFKKFNEYSSIKAMNGINRINYNDVDPTAVIPCNYDLYKMAFIAGYYGMIKDRSDLVGAILLKMDLDGNIQFINTPNGPAIQILPNQYLSRKLDKDLYDLLLSASNYNCIYSNHLNNYAKEHYLRVMTWFNMGFNESIIDEINHGNIERKVKRKRLQLLFKDSIYETARNIAGIKRYLININQTPNVKIESDNNYKYLIILAELLGIGRQVGEEILRVRPDDAMAKELLKVESNKQMFKHVYKNAVEEYKIMVKNSKNKTIYDPELERIFKQQDNNTERVSRI